MTVNSPPCALAPVVPVMAVTPETVPVPLIGSLIVKVPPPLLVICAPFMAIVL